MNSHPDINREHIAIVPISNGQLLNIREVWHYRELFFFLAWRDIKVRYKQTVLGAAWAILQPLLTMILFTIIFGKLLQVDTYGVPYPVFSFVALLPWQLFAFSLTNASNSLINDKNLVSKVYFPRMVVPFSSVVAGLADFSIGFILLVVLMLIFDVSVSSRILTLPLFILLALASALSVGIWLSALIVKYRDFQYVIPFLTQFWMYATPIAYPASLIPEKWQALYSLNPMVGVVEGFRWALLGYSALNITSLAISTGAVIVLLVTGLFYFRSMEDSFADLI